MDQDVIIVGGSFAGMAAALQLLRARRSVLVIDSAQRRNHVATRSHGVLGQDGTDPAQFVRIARSQLEAYLTLSWVDAEAVSIEGQRDSFTVTTDDAGQRYSARRILFATGVTDHLPQVEGLAERWGRSIFHCPYCDGYELGQGRIGVIGSGSRSLHQAELLTEWGQVTFLPNGALEFDSEEQRSLEERGVIIERTPIARIEAEADLRLSDGRLLSFSGLFTATMVTPRSVLPAQIGCEIEETPMGIIIWTDEAKESTVPGVYACGDLAHVPHSVSFAVADGAMAGMQLHRSLIWEKSDD